MRTEGRIRILLILIPWLIIAGMVITAYLPVLRGQKYLMRVKPVDPRDFFRGNFVALSYDFSMIDRHQLRVSLDEKREYRFGDRLYLGLENKDGILTPVALSDDAEKLKSIRLKVHTRWRLEPGDKQFNLDAGLDSFFAPAAEAEAWEKPLRAGEVFAEVAIDGGGNARLTGLVKKMVEPPPAAPKLKTSSVVCETVAQCWLDAAGNPIARPKEKKGRKLPRGSCSGDGKVWLRHELRCEQNTCVARFRGDKC